MNFKNPKKVAAEKAVEFVKDGMILGLGTGSTTRYAIKRIGELVKEGLEVIGIPTSIDSTKLAHELNIPLSNLEEHQVIDLTIDGADEVDPKFNLIKGMGGALLREKIVASHSKKEIIIVDSKKLVNILGTKSPLPVEIDKFGWNATVKELLRFGCSVEIRKKEGKVFISDNENYIADCKFSKIENPKEMERKINNIPGVLENGMFLGLTDIVVVGTEDSVRVMHKE